MAFAQKDKWTTVNQAFGFTKVLIDVKTKRTCRYRIYYLGFIKKSGSFKDRITLSVVIYAKIQIKPEENTDFNVSHS